MKEFKFTIDGKQYNAAVNELEDNFAEVTLNGKLPLRGGAGKD